MSLLSITRPTKAIRPQSGARPFMAPSSHVCPGTSRRPQFLRSSSGTSTMPLTPTAAVSSTAMPTKRPTTRTADTSRPTTTPTSPTSLNDACGSKNRLSQANATPHELTSPEIQSPLQHAPQAQARQAHRKKHPCSPHRTLHMLWPISRQRRETPQPDAVLLQLGLPRPVEQARCQKRNPRVHEEPQRPQPILTYPLPLLRQPIQVNSYR